MVHGSTMLTRDVNVCIAFEQDNVQKLMDCLQPNNPVFRDHCRMPYNKLEVFKNIYLSTDLGPIDCLGEIKGLSDYEALTELSETFTLGEYHAASSHWTPSSAPRKRWAANVTCIQWRF